MFRKTVLPNKLRILTAPMKGTNTVTVLVLCGTGSDNEREAERGISHFLEHMFFKGTKKRPSVEVVSRELTSKGSMSNAFTGHEYTGYFIKAGRVHFDWAIEFLADIYTNALLKPADINRERQVIIEEMHMRADTPESFIWEIYESLAYGNQVAGRSILGTEAQIRGFKPQQFRAYFANQYAAGNTVVIIAGNVDEGHAITKVRQLFGKIRVSKTRILPAFRNLQKTPQLKIHEKKTDQSHLVIGFHGFAADHKDRFAADLLGAILGGNLSSRMWLAIREKLGVAYNIASSHDSYSNRGMLVTYAGIAHTNVEKAMQAILAEYRRIITLPVTRDELTRVKDYLKGTMLIGLESSSAVANFVGIEEVLTGKPLTVDEVFKKIDALTPADITQAASAIIRPERMNMALIGPFKDDRKFAKLLKL
ncbi:MAG: hypothetical protein A3H71_01690 [Candidatus Sungbacteria bacterium RIFCSPLOWO2_02_FULL_48_13b]|uniref:Peptidase M16 n=2 Tax=Candidatus Sungiibacteriota TaxID=1817917 RepID=A0A1G2LJE4_9BACT|nr:MAG: hypothetical protein A3C12_02360 [Candidatus Sungbacteria bacterium RIFCSPHIGHO2_02_FULL_49_20]OHA11634.1 MAG: hypothetical protein A3H71_01690 [Candidatus Sungbacteria bacterium RIFCSPLOWO2_02_FULL_48_13b]